MVVMDVGLPKHSIAWEIHKGVGWICGEVPKLQWEDSFCGELLNCHEVLSVMLDIHMVCVLGRFVSSWVCSKFFKKLGQISRN